jgi:pilus assembly protein CpaF
MTRIVGNILRRAGRVFDPSAMITNARLPDGTFINVIMPPGAVKGPTLTIRKRSKHVLTLAELVKRDMLSEPMAEFLSECVEARLNIVICGGLRSGRTTLLNALAALIPASERIVTIEDVAELQFEQKQVIALEARLIPSGEPGQDQENNAGMRELLFNALRLRPERLVVGDCWDDEAGVLLSALHNGYAGSLFNMYANGLQDCLNRLEMMWLANRPATPLAITREQVARVVDIVIYLARLTGGVRKVMNIAEVVGTQDGRIRARSIFHYQEHGEGQGRFEPGGFVPAHLPELRHSRLTPGVFMAHPAMEARQGHVPSQVRA